MFEVATHIAIIPTGVYKCITSIPSVVPSWILPMENLSGNIACLSWVFAHVSSI